ncbi:unnamed protein product [Urochloa humidicola]
MNEPMEEAAVSAAMSLGLCAASTARIRERHVAAAPDPVHPQRDTLALAGSLPWPRILLHVIFAWLVRMEGDPPGSNFTVPPPPCPLRTT